MSDYQSMKERVRKLSSRAMQLKMDLHDLSEELPVNWELIPTLAQQTHDAFRDLSEARAELEAIENAQESTQK